MDDHQSIQTNYLIFSVVNDMIILCQKGINNNQ